MWKGRKSHQACNSFDNILTAQTYSPLVEFHTYSTLLQNQLTDLEQKAIINDINHHIGETHIVHMYGLKDLDTQVTLRQNVTIHFQKLLLVMRPPDQSLVACTGGERNHGIGHFCV